MRQQGEKISAQALIVMGVSGSGKSTLAALLAERLACPFLEGDSFHSSANVAKMRSGKPLTDADRWPWLDRLGAEIDAAVQASQMAVATCSALKRVYRDRLRAAISVPTAFVLLEANREELTRRLNSRSGHYMPSSLLESQLALLERPDVDERSLTLDGMLPLPELVEQVMDWLATDRAVAERRLA